MKYKINNVEYEVEKVVYVSKKGKEGNPGTKEEPFLTVNQAQLNVIGDTSLKRNLPTVIEVDEGDYVFNEYALCSYRTEAGFLADCYNPIIYRGRGTKTRLIMNKLSNRPTYEGRYYKILLGNPKSLITNFVIDMNFEGCNGNYQNCITAFSVGTIANNIIRIKTGTTAFAYNNNGGTITYKNNIICGSFSKVSNYSGYDSHINGICTFGSNTSTNKVLTSEQNARLMSGDFSEFKNEKTFGPFAGDLGMPNSTSLGFHIFKQLPNVSDALEGHFYYILKEEDDTKKLESYIFSKNEFIPISTNNNETTDLVNQEILNKIGQDKDGNLTFDGNLICNDTKLDLTIPTFGINENLSRIKDLHPTEYIENGVTKQAELSGIEGNIENGIFIPKNLKMYQTSYGSVSKLFDGLLTQGYSDSCIMLHSKNYNGNDYYLEFSVREKCDMYGIKNLNYSQTNLPFKVKIVENNVETDYYSMSDSTMEDNKWYMICPNLLPGITYRLYANGTGHSAGLTEIYLNVIKESLDNSEFPIKVADETIKSEEDIAKYSNNLNDGKRLLLIVPKLNKIFLTDGNGGYVSVINSINLSLSNQEVLEKFSEDDNGTLLFNGKPIESKVEVVENLPFFSNPNKKGVE